MGTEGIRAERIGTDMDRGQETAVEAVDTEEGQGLTLEEAFETLEDTVARLESEDITLEESFRIYQKGMEILKYCNDKIDRVEKKVLRINEDGQTDEF